MSINAIYVAGYLSEAGLNEELRESLVEKEGYTVGWYTEVLICLMRIRRAVLRDYLIVGD